MTKQIKVAGFTNPEPDPSTPPKWNENVVLAGSCACAPASLFRRTKK